MIGGAKEIDISQSRLSAEMISEAPLYNSIC